MSSKAISFLFLLFIGAASFLAKSISSQLKNEEAVKSNNQSETETSDEGSSVDIEIDFDIQVDLEESVKQPTPIEDIEGLTANVIKILKENNINTLEEAQLMSDMDLVEIKGIGVKTIELLKPNK
jgi:DNA-directed RNA polymerase alpha subunit